MDGMKPHKTFKTLPQAFGSGVEAPAPEEPTLPDLSTLTPEQLQEVIAQAESLLEAQAAGPEEAPEEMA